MIQRMSWGMAATVAVAATAILYWIGVVAVGKGNPLVYWGTAIVAGVFVGCAIAWPMLREILSWSDRR